MPTPIEAYTTKEFAELLGIKPRTVVDYIDAKLIKAVPWVDRRWLIPKRELERLQKVGIDTKGLHSKLSKNRRAPALAAPKVVPKAAPKAAPKPEAKPPKKPAAAVEPPPKPSPPKTPVVLSVDDTRFAGYVPKVSPRAVAPQQKAAAKPEPSYDDKIAEKYGAKPPEMREYHGKKCTPREIKFIKWLQQYAKGKTTIAGANVEWRERCGGVLDEEEIKNVIAFLRAKRFIVCDGCNTIFAVRNLDEFFTCAPVEGNALPRGYIYV